VRYSKIVTQRLLEVGERPNYAQSRSVVAPPPLHSVSECDLAFRKPPVHQVGPTWPSMHVRFAILLKSQRVVLFRALRSIPAQDVDARERLRPPIWAGVR
jgi:hypothetical protein